MNITKKTNQYRSKKTGNIVFVYAVNGTDKELKEYKDTQGEFYREDEDTKAPLFFSTRVCQIGADVVKSKSGTFNVLSDLEAEAIAVVAATTQATGKIHAIANVMGMTPAQLGQQMLIQIAV